MAMDAKDLRTDAVLGDRSNDGNIKYGQGGATLPCNRTKPYQDIGSNSLAKVDVQTARPCAVIGPDRVVPPAASSDAYLKKGPVEPWLTTDNSYRRPPDYPHKALDYQHPARNISPRQTFQENMQRIMVPPSYNSVKLKEDHNFSVDSNIPSMRNNKFNLPPDSKYCEVPYAVNNAMTNEQKTVRNSDISVPTMNPLARGMPHAWPPNSANIRPPKPYGTPELYQYPEYSSCAGPRPMLMPRPHRTMHEEAGHMYSDPYYQDGSIRFKPYPTVKERFTQPRYDYISNYSNPFHPPPPFPTHKYELQKPVHSHPYAGYPQVPIKYIDSRMPEPIMNGYQRPNPQAHYSNVPFRNQVIHPSYGTVAGNCLQTNKYFPFPPDSSAKSNTSNKLPYDPNNKIFPESFYVNDLARTHSMKGQVLPPNYPGNPYGMPPHPYYRRENPTMKGYEFVPHVRNIDPSMPMNGPSLSRFPSQFSPSTVAISPSDSNTSNDTNQTQGTAHEDCGYISQTSSVSMRSMDSGNNRMPYDIYRRYDQRYNSVVKSSLMPKYEDNSHAGSKDKKDIDVRQFLQMWNEGEEENGDNNLHENSVHMLTNAKNMSKAYEANSQEQLYVLGLVNVPSEELGKYDHIQKVSKLPENIKGYNSIELLHQFEEVIESSNLNNYNSKPAPRTFDTSLKGPSAATLHGLGIPTRPLSPLDVEAKISQSVIHKEVGCNFEIKPCSPKMLNVEIATPVQTVLGERVIEKVTNPLIGHSPTLNNTNENLLKCQEQRLNKNVSSCKMIHTQFSSSDHNSSVKTNYSLQDLESNSGVCLASLPRLDNDIELSFPEVNQQFINANKVESVITTTNKDLPDLDRSEAKDQGLLEIDQCLTKPDIEKDISKLSKYRKLKRKVPEPKENTQETNVQALRKDSVIIKNPENVKYQGECITNSPKTKTDDAQQDPINLTVASDNRTDAEQSDVEEKVSILNNSRDLAIDFSLSSEHYNAKDDSPIIKINTNVQQEEENKDYLLNDDCAESTKSTFSASFSDIIPASEDSKYDDTSKSTTNESAPASDHVIFVNEEKIISVEEKSENVTSTETVSRFETETGKLYPTDDEFHYNNIAQDQGKCVTENVHAMSAILSNKIALFDEKDTSSLKNIEECCIKSEVTQTDPAINQRIEDLVNDLCVDKNNSMTKKKSYKRENIQSSELATNSSELVDDTLNNKQNTNEGTVFKKKGKAYKPEKRRDKRKAHKIKTFKINFCKDSKDTNKLDYTRVVSIQTGKNKETREINQFVNASNDSREAQACASSDYVDSEKSTSINIPMCSVEQQDSINQVDIPPLTTAQNMDLPCTPEISQEIKIISRNSSELQDNHVAYNIPKEVENPTNVPVKSKKIPTCMDKLSSQFVYVSKESQENFVHLKSPEINESIYFDDILEDPETYIQIGDMQKSQEKDKLICSPEESRDQEELKLSMNCYGSKEIKDIDKLTKRKVYCSELINSETETISTNSKHKINKELFSPRIQKLILQEEGLCLNEFGNIGAMTIKNPPVIKKPNKISDCASSDHKISKSFEIFDDDTAVTNISSTEYCSVDVLESIKESTSKRDNGAFDSGNVRKDDSDECKEDDVMNKIVQLSQQSTNLDITMKFNLNEELDEQHIPPLETETIRTSDSQKMDIVLSQSNSNSIDYDAKIFVTDATRDISIGDEYVGKSPETIREDVYVNEPYSHSNLKSHETLGNAGIVAQSEHELLLHPEDSTTNDIIEEQVPLSPNFDTAEEIHSIECLKKKTKEIQNIEKINTQSFNSMITIDKEFSSDLSASGVGFDYSSTQAKPDEMVIAETPKAKNLIDGESHPLHDLKNIENTIQQEGDKYRRDENINQNLAISNKYVDTDDITDFEDDDISTKSPYLQEETSEHSLVNEINCRNEEYENVKIVQEIAIGCDIGNRNKICTNLSQDVIQNQHLKFDQNKKVHYSSNYRYKKKKTLKRSLSESALDDICDNSSEGCDNRPIQCLSKRQKVEESENVPDSHFVPESYCNLIQQNRRNSVSSMYNEDNVSFCILIENNCIIDEEEVEAEKICFAEIRDLPCIEDNSENVISETDDVAEETTEEVAFQDEIIVSPSAVSCENEDKALEDAWVDDVAYVETVVSDDVAEDIVISASSSPNNDSDVDEELNDDVDIYGDHTDKVKYIYGDKMCSDDAHLVETLYRTPQMDVNKTLVYRESQVMEECHRYYDKESLEKVLSDSVNEEVIPEIAEVSHNLNFPNLGYSTATTNETIHDCKEFHNIESSSPFICSRDKLNNNSHGQFVEKKDIENIPKIPIEQTQDRSIYSCESSVDNVFSYIQREESPKHVTSSSPEVSSTTSEEKNASILLTITNYNGSRISEINNINSGNRISCKYTEDKDYNISSHNNLPPRPLITKAAQKYIPPLKESIPDLKVQLTLPQHSLLKLKQLKVAKEKPKSIPKKSNTVCRKEIPKKPKPKFEDVLKSIDEIQVQKHKNSKKIKKDVPKVVIKKIGDGSHYASTSNPKDKYNPDLTGRKWQPWVFIERNNFIDKMALKKKTRAVFSYRKNEYVLAENFRKYRSVGSAKFVISQPKLNDTISGQLKYTIKLKHL